MNIDVEKLIEALEDYYGTAMHNGFPMAVIELENIKSLSPQELIKMAQSAGLNLRDFEVEEDIER